MNTKACLSDEDIIELYFARNERAIAETENKYGRLLYTVAFRCVGDAEWARECQNDTYLAVWNRIPPEHPMNLQAYLTAITRNLSVNRYKKESAQGRIPTAMTVAMQDLEFALPSGDAPDDRIEQERLAAAIGSFVRGLDKKRRYIFIERYYMAGAVPDIAVALGIGDSAVYKELAKLKKKLKKYLERNDFTV